VRNKAKALANAQKQLGRGNLDRALKEYYAILKEDPKDLRVRQKIAELLARKGTIPEAIKEFSTVAEAYERGGFYPKAVAIYKQILRYEPKMMVWHLSLAEIYQQLAHTSDAMEHFNIVAQHYEHEGSIRERIDIYKRLIRVKPAAVEYSDKLAAIYLKEADMMGAVDVWRNFAEVAEKRKDGEGVVHAHEKMSDLRPTDTELARKLADLYLDRGEAKKALGKLQFCFRTNPQDTETLNLLADAFVDLGEVAKATAVLKELAQIYESIGYESYRNQVYDRIAQLDPSAGESTGASLLSYPAADSAIEGLALGVPDGESEAITRSLLEVGVFMAYGLPAKAQACLEKLLAREPECYEARRQLLRVTVAEEDVDGALAQLTGLYELAMGKSDHSVARACLIRTTELYPEDAGAQQRLEAFEEAMGGDLEAAGGSGPAETPPEDSVVAPASASLLASSAADSEIGSFLDEALDEDDDAFDDFDFDDDEIAKLAAELEDIDSSELSPDIAPPISAPDVAGDGSDSEESFDLSIEIGDENGGDVAEGLDFGFLDQDAADAETEVTSTDLVALLARATSLFEAGDYTGATEALREALVSDATSVDTMLLLGRSLRLLGDIRGSVDILKQLLATSSANTDQLLAGMFHLAEAYEAGGNSEGAYKIYKRVVAQRSDFGGGEARNKLAALESQLGIN
jgi:tetratricopeptide (TPR) repeat protein